MSAPLVGTMIGRLFRERLGVREGAVESPNLFNAYFDEISARLLALHPRLCKLIDIVIPILLYADDAALPADSIEDLALSLAIFEEFCNNNRLFISTSKTCFTVFHDPSDQGVKYYDGKLCLDGREVALQVYGQCIEATEKFKYLGIWLHASGSSDVHVEARLLAFERASAALRRG
eukprot:555334-Karenia_brevis.AAC.1